MIVLKFVGKVLAFPVVFLLGILLFAYGTAERVICFFVGAINVFYLIGVIAATIMGDTWYYVQQAMLFFLIEGVLLAIPQLCAEGIRHIRERLQDFIWT